MQSETKLVIFLSITMTILISSVVYIFLDTYFGVYPSLKEYEVYGKPKTFGDNLVFLLKNDTNAKVKFQDTSLGQNGPHISIYIEYNTPKDSIRYFLSYEPTKKQSLKHDHLKLKLIGAFDYVKNTGGYNKEDEKTKEIIDSFDTLIIKKIQGLLLKTN